MQAKRGKRLEVPAEPDWALEGDLPARVVVVGDLNAQYALFRRFLEDLKLVKKNGAWCGGKTVLFQMGDIPNRGAGARAAMDLMMDLLPQAREAGGDVYWLLGNHEVMSVLGHEAYVSAEEYLEFATVEEIDRFYSARTRYLYELLGPPELAAIVEPTGGRIKAWEEAFAPGKGAYRSAMGPSGLYGQFIRRLPIAVKLGPLLFVHGGLSPGWAQLGLSGLTDRARLEWSRRPLYYQELDPHGLFRDPLGPLWHRAYCVSNAKVVRRDLQDSLGQMRATQMLVGHTRTDTVPGGEASVPLLRQRGRLIMTDVGLGDAGEGGSVLVIEKGVIESWSAGGTKSVVVPVKTR